MFENIKMMTETELKDLKEDLLNHVEEIDDELEHHKKLSKPYRYFVESYNRDVEGGFSKSKTAENKFTEYINKDRIGSSLIYYGYTYKYKEDSIREIEDLMVLNNSAVENRGNILGIVRKVFSNDYDLSKIGGSYKEIYSIILEDVKNKLKNVKIPKEMESDFIKLGQLMDDKNFKDKEEFISNAELDYYKIRYISGKIIINKKGK